MTMSILVKRIQRKKFECIDILGLLDNLWFLLQTIDIFLETIILSVDFFVLYQSSSISLILRKHFFWQLPSIQTNMAVYEQVDAVKYLVFYWHFILYSKNKLSIISLNEKKKPKNKMSLLQREDISLIKNSNFPALYKSYKVSFFPGNFRDNHYTVQLLYLFHHKSS